MKPVERRWLMAEGAVAAESPRERRGRIALAEDVASSPLAGRPLALRLRNFHPTADGYLASLGGPLPYMLRLRAIDAATEAHVGLLRAAWHGLADEVPDEAVFARRWLTVVERWSFDEVNDLVDRHNRWYPAEARLPMDPATGDYALVNGTDYRCRPLDAAWALERFPAVCAAASARPSRPYQGVECGPLGAVDVA